MPPKDSPASLPIILLHYLDSTKDSLESIERCCAETNEDSRQIRENVHHLKNEFTANRELLQQVVDELAAHRGVLERIAERLEVEVPRTRMRGLSS